MAKNTEVAEAEEARVLPPNYYPGNRLPVEVGAWPVFGAVEQPKGKQTLVRALKMRSRFYFETPAAEKGEEPVVAEYRAGYLVMDDKDVLSAATVADFERDYAPVWPEAA